MRLYEQRIIENIKYKISDFNSIIKYRKRKEDFIRERKMPFSKVVLYSLCKKGLTSKMEINEFDEIVNTADISSPGVLKQREKLDARIYKDMMNDNNICFYNEYSKEVKLFKGYILTASDGSDFEIPNTTITRKKSSKISNSTSAARIQVCNTFDILNKFILATNFKYGKSDERSQVKKNHEEISKLNLKFPTIDTRDRGYMSYKEIYYLNKRKQKYVIRMVEKNYRNIIENMKSDDEIVTIKYNNRLIEKYIKKDIEYCEEMKENKPEISFRVIINQLSTGEKEYLATNLDCDKFSSEDIKEIYRLRWEIETNFHALKESLKIETISSSKEELIKQDVYSQMLAHNTLRAFVNKNNKKIDHSKYKHKMNTNLNMAVGFFKKYFIYILIEKDEEKQRILLEKLENNIKRHLSPERKNRRYNRDKKTKNKYPINKRKSF